MEGLAGERDEERYDRGAEGEDEREEEGEDEERGEA